MAALRSQNQALLARIQQIQQMDAPSKNNDEKNPSSAVKTLEAEKTVLQCRVQQLSDRLEKLQTTRDAYWQSQMALHENELQNNNQQKLDETKKQHTDFLNDVASLLSRYLPSSYDGTDQATLSVISNVVDKVALAEKKAAIANHKAELMQQQKNEVDTSNIPRVVKTIQSLQEWEKWANEMFTNATGLDSKKFQDKELRNRLGEMVLSSIGNKKLLSDLDSLRTQKEALMRGAGCVESERELQLGALAKVVAFGVRLSKSKQKLVSPIGVTRVRNTLRNN